jgi:hypothetical protein
MSRAPPIHPKLNLLTGEPIADCPDFSTRFLRGRKLLPKAPHKISQLCKAHLNGSKADQHFEPPKIHMYIRAAITATRPEVSRDLLAELTTTVRKRIQRLPATYGIIDQQIQESIPIIYQALYQYELWKTTQSTTATTSTSAHTAPSTTLLPQASSAASASAAASSTPKTTTTAPLRFDFKDMDATQLSPGKVTLISNLCSNDERGYIPPNPVISLPHIFHHNEQEIRLIMSAFPQWFDQDIYINAIEESDVQGNSPLARLRTQLVQHQRTADDNILRFNLLTDLVYRMLRIVNCAMETQKEEEQGTRQFGEQ